eukprot:637836-Prorocentrum_minimum.AAC.2
MTLPVLLFRSDPRSKAKYPLVVADECHALKSPDAKRSQVDAPSPLVIGSRSGCRLAACDWLSLRVHAPLSLAIGSRAR